MRALKKGMWVVSDLGVGILAVHRFAVAAAGTRRPVHHEGIKPGETLVREQWVHLTDDNGDTLTQIPADRCRNLRQAAASDLPQKRVGHLSQAQLAELGYV